jgi:hypothetical protein
MALSLRAQQEAGQKFSEKGLFRAAIEQLSEKPQLDILAALILRRGEK